MKKEDCIFNKVYLFNQNIKKEQINDLLETMYNNICFSTFPYLLYKHEHSKKCVQKFNSGTCISFCYFIQMYLEKNFNIKSYIIGASVPNIFKVEGTPHICHCAVLIPIHFHEFYILDGALYFLEPMFCSLQDNRKRTILNSNVHNHEKTKIHYEIHKCDNYVLDHDYNQTIPEKSLSVCATFVSHPYDEWYYYLNEIANPDNNIGHAFLLFKSSPFLMFTRFEDNMVKMKYKVDIENDEMVIRKYPERDIIYQGLTLDNDPLYMDIIKELHPYFLDYVI